MGRPATRIVFDLDGTLVQTRIASWEVFRTVQAEFGLHVETPEEFFTFFEGNFFASLNELVPDIQTANALVARFFEHLEHAYHPVIIPGMVSVARALASRATLAVLSSNATSVIRRVLTENGLEFCFSHVFGGDVEPDKSVGLRRFLADAAQGVGRRCTAPYDEGADGQDATAADTVLVTDTVGDVRAAVAAGVRVVGVSWGMHSSDRLRAAGAEFVAMWPQELIAYLLPDEDAHGRESGTSCELVSMTSFSDPSRPSVPASAPMRPPAGASAPFAEAGTETHRLAAGDISRAVDIRRSRRRVPSAVFALPAPASLDLSPPASECCAPSASTESIGTPRRSSDAMDEMSAAMRTIIGVAARQVLTR